MNSEVVLIIPVYNEETVIKNVINKALKKYKHIVCVNDGSRDNSAAEVAKTEAEAQAQAAGAFGDWDIRREPTTRNVPDETQFESIEKRDFDTFSNTEADHGSEDDGDELSTPPFFRRKK